MIDFREHSVIWLSKQIQQKQISSREVVTAAIENIEKYNPAVNAFVAVDYDRALTEADAADAKIFRGEPVGLLEGIPFGVKDVHDSQGFKTSMGSHLTDGLMPAQEDSDIVSKLKKQGAITIGKTNTPEFAWAPDTRNIKFGPTYNPWNIKFTSGGSSGGSAAAIASSMVPIATGSDGGGSLRIPSAVCGLNILKPTLGVVSHADSSHEAWQGLSTSGFMTRTLSDQLALFKVLSEFNIYDYQSLKYDFDSDRGYLDKEKPKVIKLGYCPTLGYAIVDSLVKEKTLSSLILLVDRLNLTDAAELNKTVFEIVELESVFDEDPLPLWFNQVGAYTYYSLESLKEQEKVELKFENCDPMIGFLYNVGATLSVKDLITSQRHGYYMSLKLSKVFESCDYLLCPTIAGIPPHSGEMGTVNSEPTMNWVQLTYPFNMTRSPVISLFIDKTNDGIPMGMQIIGPRFSDYKLLKLGSIMERYTDTDSVAAL